MSASIRRAKNEDAEFLAWAMLAASRAHLPIGVWDLLIGLDEAGCLDYLSRLAVAEPVSLCHFESFLVAEVDGRVEAALSTFAIHEGGWATVGQAMGNVQHELGWTQADLDASHKRVAPVWACFLPDVGADWGIENIATRPGSRGQGLCGLLLKQALDDGRQHGCRLAHITTFIGNDDALSVYKRAGFEFSDEKRCAGMEIVLNTPGFVRLLCKL
jgi:GNAT superfamily N-acetyltransferase